MAVASIPVDWGLAQQPTDLDFTPSAVEGADAAVKQAQAGQALRGISALRNIDLNDPNSVNTGIGALIQNGMIQQGSALQGLNYERFKQQGIQALAGQHPYADAASAATQAGPTPSAAPQPQPSPQQPNPQQIAFLRDAKNAADNVSSVWDPADPTLAKAQLDASNEELTSKYGIPADYISHMAGDPADPGFGQRLAGISDHINQVLQHPTFGGSGDGSSAPIAHPDSQAYFDRQQPSARPLNPLYNPAVLDNLRQENLYGVDIGNEVKADEGSMGYTGPVGPGQTVAAGGSPEFQTPYAPTAVNINDRLVNPNLPNGSNTIAPATPLPVLQSQGQQALDAQGHVIAAPPPYPKSLVPVAPSDVMVVFNPNSGQTNQAVESGTGDTSVARDGGISAPQVKFQPGTVMPPAQASDMVHNPGSFFGKILGSNGVQITSAARSPEHNAAVGGVPTSEHIPANGTAYDFIAPSGMTNQQAIQRIVASGVPFDQLIDEGNHIHFGVGPQMRGQVLGGGAPSSSSGLPIAGKTIAPPAPHAGVPGNSQVDFTGRNTGPIPGTYIDASSTASQLASSPPVLTAQKAMTDLTALRANAGQMTGPAALAMLETFGHDYAGLTAKAPVTAIMDAFSIPEQMRGGLQKAFAGQGPLTNDMRQQIADASYNLAKAQYDTATGIINGRKAAVQQTGGDPTLLNNILPPTPPRKFYLTQPPASEQHIGNVIDSRNGPRQWNGHTWVPTNG